MTGSQLLLAEVRSKVVDLAIACMQDHPIEIQGHFSTTCCWGSKSLPQLSLCYYNIRQHFK